MANYYLTNQAVEDLNNIYEYSFYNWSEQQADSYYRIILDYCQSIADNPLIGKNYEGVAADWFGLKVKSHIVFYRMVSKDIVEITRILHEKMDLRNRILD